METLKVLPWRLPQPLQRSFRARSSSLVYGRRPCCSSLASMWVRFRQAAQECDNTQNDANHIHSVWHDLERN